MILSLGDDDVSCQHHKKTKDYLPRTCPLTEAQTTTQADTTADVEGRIISWSTGNNNMTPLSPKCNAVKATGTIHESF